MLKARAALLLLTSLMLPASSLLLLGVLAVASTAFCVISAVAGVCAGFGVSSVAHVVLREPL